MQLLTLLDQLVDDNSSILAFRVECYIALLSHKDISLEEKRQYANFAVKLLDDPKGLLSLQMRSLRMLELIARTKESIEQHFQVIICRKHSLSLSHPLSSLFLFANLFRMPLTMQSVSS